jgi:hypothetical protein
MATRGNTGAAVGVAALSVTYLVFLPALLVLAIYGFVTVYAIVKATGRGSDLPSAAVIMLGIILIVTSFVALLGGLILLVGRTMTPRKRDDAEFGARAESPEKKPQPTATSS